MTTQPVNTFMPKDNDRVPIAAGSSMRRLSGVSSVLCSLPIPYDEGVESETHKSGKKSAKENVIESDKSGTEHIHNNQYKGYVVSDDEYSSDEETVTDNVGCDDLQDSFEGLSLSSPSANPKTPSDVELIHDLMLAVKSLQFECTKLSILEQKAKKEASESKGEVASAKKKAKDAQKQAAALAQENERLLDLIKCPSCHEVKEDMHVTITCGHRICFGCYWRAGSSVCITCRATLKKESKKLKRLY